MAEYLYGDDQIEINDDFEEPDDAPEFDFNSAPAVTANHSALQPVPLQQHQQRQQHQHGGHFSQQTGGFRSVEVSGLPDAITEESLSFIFQTYGEVENVYLAHSIPNAPPGVARVFFVDAASASSAVDALNGTNVDGVVLCVTPYFPPPPPQSAAPPQPPPQLHFEQHQSPQQPRELPLVNAFAKDHGPPRNYKTRMCKFFPEGKCHHGASCMYAHSNEELERGGGGGFSGGRGGSDFTGGGGSSSRGGDYAGGSRGGDFGGGRGGRDFAGGGSRGGSDFAGGRAGGSFAGASDAGRGGGTDFAGSSGGPPPRTGTGPPSLPSTDHRFKTRICQYWQNGSCSRGYDCGFAHGQEDLQTGEQKIMTNFKTRICKYWEEGTCTKGEQCVFAHGSQDLISSRGRDMPPPPRRDAHTRDDDRAREHRDAPREAHWDRDRDRERGPAREPPPPPLPLPLPPRDERRDSKRPFDTWEDDRAVRQRGPPPANEWPSAPPNSGRGEYNPRGDGGGGGGGGRGNPRGGAWDGNGSGADFSQRAPPRYQQQQHQGRPPFSPHAQRPPPGAAARPSAGPEAAEQQSSQPAAGGSFIPGIGFARGP